MDLALILRELWRLRVWVAVVFVVAVLVALGATVGLRGWPPALGGGTLQFGAASTQALVDSRRSSLSNLDQDLDPLSVRAGIYARLAASPTVKESIASQAGISAAELTTVGPSPGGSRAAREPTSERRAAELIAEGQLYRVRFEAEDELPTISVFTQAPDPREAEALADAAVGALRDRIREFESARVPPRLRVQVRQLGPAEGGWVNRGTDYTVTALAFLGTLVAGCVLLLLGANVRRSLRDSRDASDAGGPGGDHDGEPARPEPPRANGALAPGSLDENVPVGAGRDAR